jgi:hypothetical protein
MQKGYQQRYATGAGHPGLLPGSPGYVPPGTLASVAVAFPGPILPDSPTLPSTLPPVGCPPLASVWSAIPTDPAGNEIGYTPPAAEPNDDGVTFPAQPSDVILSQAWHGMASTTNPINIARYNLEIEQAIHDAIAQAKATTSFTIDTPDTSVSSSITIPPNPIYDIWVAAEQAVLTKLLQGTGLWYELVLKPLTNGPFSNYYVVQTTDLLIPQTINLQAPSSGMLLLAPRTQGLLIDATRT